MSDYESMSLEHRQSVHAMNCQVYAMSDMQRDLWYENHPLHYYMTAAEREAAQTPPDNDLADGYRPVKLQHVVPDAWITAMANPPEQDPNNMTGNWRKLYSWLGEQAKVSRQEASDNELAANLDTSVGPRYHAEAFSEVRNQMLRMDPTLPHRARVRYQDRNRNHSTCTVCSKRCARVQGPKGPRWAHADSSAKH